MFRETNEGKEREALLRSAVAGFTLIEIMVVVAIIGLLMGTVGVVAYNRFKKAQLTNTKQIVVNMKNAIEQYALDTNEPCPKSLEELKTAKIINKDPKDAWGQPLIYKCPGENDDPADISSAGPDRKPGTEDDINSWDL